MQYDYDIIVVGGGHAGMEAAFASAHMGANTLLLTLNIKMMSNMPCNPSIGGSAKGIVVREVDALGGMMGKGADHEYLQMKMLNTGKGPGVQCLRAQADKKSYPRWMQEQALNTKNLTIKEGMVTSLLHDEEKVFGVAIGEEKIIAKAVILTTGTYMESCILQGHTSRSAGPDGEKPSLGLSPYLATMGINLFRLKTGTPPRIQKDSIDYTRAEPQYGTEGELAFSYETKEFKPLEEQILCWLIYTTPETHQIIRDNLHESAMYSGLVKGIGPRYCPSIEDKIVRFADKPRHQLFLEPESLEMDSIYLQGFSTSMPPEIQEKMIRSLPGLENCKVLKYAYAIEYDAIEPTQFDATLQVKRWPGLYCAGQICGTSGYEEAAGLGIMAGINATLKIKGKKPLILRRDESYIGVMIDDLVTKGTEEPYRLLSSRAEYRLLLRHDNADLRLTEYGYNVGLIGEERYKEFLAKKVQINKAIEYLEHTFVGIKSDIKEYLNELGYELNGGISLIDILRRPDVSFKRLQKYYPELQELNLSNTAIMQLEVMVKYEGYIEKQKKEAERLAKLEEMKLSPNIDYLHMDGLALEARQKLDEIKPLSIGQASRISGVNPADISMLILNIKKENA
ncbi:MAG: tRNA uridine-5-carboxymethylaminomethyl(34) synthesis enzyme MnmG [Erysipelotrichales bacterium]|nr:tRNA uridine-5-carboxymethylaminomethyl(34) synthesis enzyme MnmG [Erysipelotrichales bacterium]